MTLKLYFGPGACSFVPHTLLETSGAPYEPVLVKLHKQENLGPEFRGYKHAACHLDGAFHITS